MLLAVCVIAAAPATAFADGAGDEQYQDPLTAPSAPKKAKKKAATAPNTTAPAATTTPAATAAPALTSSAQTTSQPAAAAAPAAGTLPRTGAPTDLIAL